MEYGILGPLTVSRDGRELRLGGAKQRSVLAVLLLRANELVPTARIVDELWGERPPPTAVKAVQVQVSKLRKLLDEGALETRPTGYVLRVEPGALDLERFESLLERGRERLAEGETREAAGLLREALGLWRGSPLAEFGYESFARDEIRKLEELRLVALELRLEAELALGRHAEAVPELEALIREHPLRENLRRLFMLALYRSGRQADALAAYRDARTTLVHELGLDPSESLQDLEAAILRHDPALDPATPPSRTRNAINLPAPATPLVGRERELDELDTLLHQGVRLLTLTGPGGVGKTRLALEAAIGLVDRFRSGVFWVGLAALRDPELVVPAISQVVGARSELAEHVGEREMLLVLDNLEQVIDAGPELGALVDACPKLCLLVTSRERLAVRAEAELEVRPLPDGDALSLFAARSRLEPTPAAEELCRRLDNMPLALELAAARTKTLAPDKILERLGGRLDLLTGGRDADPRQRSLRATIDWSYDLLEPDEQRLFTRLAVLAGGCTLEAAEQVCDAGLDTLGALVEKSLIRYGGGRYWMLETIRDYAFERLEDSGEREFLAQRHSAWMLELAERYDTVLYSVRNDEEADLVDAEHENGRAVLEYLLNSDPGTALRLAAALAVVWRHRGRSAEGSVLIATAIAAAPDAPPAVMAKALYRAGRLFYAPDEGACKASLERFVAAGDPLGAVLTRRELGLISLYRGDLDEAADAASRALEEARVLADPLTLSYANRLAAQVLEAQGDYRAGREHHLEAIRLAREGGHQVPILEALRALGWNELQAGDYGRVRETYLDLLTQSSPRDKLHRVVIALNLGWAELFLGELAVARSRFAEALGLARDLHDKRNGAEAIIAVAALHAAADNTSRVATLWGAGRGVLAECDAQPNTLELRAEKRWLEPLRDEHRADYELGTTLNLDEAIELALGSH